MMKFDESILMGCPLCGIRPKVAPGSDAGFILVYCHGTFEQNHLMLSAHGETSAVVARWNEAELIERKK